MHGSCLRNPANLHNSSNISKYRTSSITLNKFPSQTEELLTMIAGVEEKKRLFVSLLTSGLAIFKSSTEKDID